MPAIEKPTPEQLEEIRSRITDPKTRELAKEMMEMVEAKRQTMPELDKYENKRFIVGFVGDRQMVTLSGGMNAEVAEKVIICLMDMMGLQQGLEILANVTRKMVADIPELADELDPYLAPQPPKTGTGGTKPIVN